MHPCLSCGACCAMWAVEVEPDELTPALRPQVVLEGDQSVLRGTEGQAPRCDALHGQVGDRVRCTLYAQRPRACRAVEASWENGSRDEWCDRARQRHGLARLTLRDWR